MLTYRAYVQRHLRTAIDLSRSNIAIRSRYVVDNQRTTFRHYATQSSEERVQPSGSEIEEHLQERRNKGSPVDDEPQVRSRDARQVWLEKKTAAKAPEKNNFGKENASVEREIIRELEFLKDPLKLADEVRRKLQRLRNPHEESDSFDRVLSLVRLASKDTECVVSWNHIINHLMAKEKTNAAIKIFNEMKKRAQKPDALTYTLIFRGLADNAAKTPLALTHALSIYQSMHAEKTQLKPNITHTNAVLKVCSRVGDTDALFGIAAKIPALGLGSADNLTYTTILNGIRNSAVVSKSPRRVSQEVSKTVTRKATNHARRIWMDVIDRWRRAEIWIDEELVCAMGRVLLIGEEQDWDDVLSLMEQSMKIPRFLPREGTAERNAIEPRRQSSQTGVPVEADTGTREEELASFVGANNYYPEEDAFKVVKPPMMPKGADGPYAVPGNNTFDLAMQAVSKLNSKAAAAKYWAYFTENRDIKPDRAILCQYLRILRFSRSSSEAVEVLMKTPSVAYDPAAFRLALSTCVRDKKNRNAFTNAGKILDLMQQYTAKPDVRSLVHYIDVAVFSEPLPKKDPSSRTAQGRQIMRALDRLQSPFIELRSQLAFGNPDPNRGRGRGRGRGRDKNIEGDEFDYWQEGLLFVRKMISAYDKLMNNNLVEREVYSDLTKRRSLLSSYVTRHMKKFPTGGVVITRKGPMTVPAARHSASRVLSKQ